MHVDHLHIKGLKSLSDLEVSFDASADATVVFANNGVGKTTFLEAISLIGHVSCMRRVLVHTQAHRLVAEQSRSRLCRDVNRAFDADHDAFASLKASLEAHRTLHDWFASFPGDGRDGAAIRFSMRLSSDVRDIELYIVLRKGTYDFGIGHIDVTITNALSRKFPDTELENVMAVVASQDECGQKVSELIEHVFATRPHLVDGSMRARAEPVTRGSYGIVSYINTDLNDFGKGNDLRETPKDIIDDFPTEMVERLGIPFSRRAEGTYRSLEFLDDLNGHLTRILDKYPHLDGPGEGDSAAAFEISECKYNEVTGDLRFHARRRGSPANVRLDYMSAGENECFFLFLISHGLIVDNSLVLLDEPELHLSTFTQRVFFRELLSILIHKRCQVIIATHSGVGLVSVIDTYQAAVGDGQSCLQRTGRWRAAKIDARFIRPNPAPRHLRGPRDPDFLVDWPNRFPVHLYFHYLSTAWVCLSVATSRAFFLKVLMAPVYLFHAGYQRSDANRRLLWMVVAVFTMNMLGLLAAVGSDVMNLFNEQTLPTHRSAILLIAPTALLSFVLLVGCTLYLAWRGRGQ